MIKGFPSRRDNIILAAIDIISENGMRGLSTKAIAAKQGISESILYKHFKSIDEVLVAVIEYFSQFDTMILNTVRKKEIPYKKKIMEYVKSYVEFYESYPAVASILLNYDMLMHHDYTRDKTIEVIHTRTDFITTTYQKGQQEGEIGNFFTPCEVADIINGLMDSIILRWKMSEYRFNLKETVLESVKKILDRC